VGVHARVAACWTLPSRRNHVCTGTLLLTKERLRKLDSLRWFNVRSFSLSLHVTGYDDVDVMDRLVPLRRLLRLRRLRTRQSPWRIDHWNLLRNLRAPSKYQRSWLVVCLEWAKAHFFTPCAFIIRSNSLLGEVRMTLLKVVLGCGVPRAWISYGVRRFLRNVLCTLSKVCDFEVVLRTDQRPLSIAVRSPGCPVFCVLRSMPGLSGLRSPFLVLSLQGQLESLVLDVSSGRCGSSLLAV